MMTLNKLLVIFLTLTALVACTRDSERKPVHAFEGWDVGNGGDGVEGEIISRARFVLASLGSSERRSRLLNRNEIILLEQAIELTAIDVTSTILRNSIGERALIVVPDPKRPAERMIRANIMRWVLERNSGVNLVQTVFHEYLRVIGKDDSQNRYSDQIGLDESDYRAFEQLKRQEIYARSRRVASIRMDRDQNLLGAWQTENPVQILSRALSKPYLGVDGASRVEEVQSLCAGHCEAPEVALNSRGNGFVVWQKREAVTQLWVRRFSQSRRWDIPVLLGEFKTGPFDLTTKVAVDESGRELVLVSHTRETPAKSVSFRGSGNGAWKAEKVPFDPGRVGDLGVFSLVMSASGEAAALASNPKGLFALFYHPISGWRNPVPLAANGSQIELPQVAEGGGRFYAAWVERSKRSCDLRLVEWGADGLSSPSVLVQRLKTSDLPWIEHLTLVAFPDGGAALLSEESATDEKDLRETHTRITRRLSGGRIDTWDLVGGCLDRSVSFGDPIYSPLRSAKIAPLTEQNIRLVWTEKTGLYENICSGEISLKDRTRVVEGAWLWRRMPATSREVTLVPDRNAGVLGFWWTEDGNIPYSWLYTDTNFSGHPTKIYSSKLK